MTEPRLIPTVERRPMTLGDGAFVIAASLLAALLGTFTMMIARLPLELWRYGQPVFVGWPGSYPMFGMYTFTAWLLGAIVPALLTSVLLSGAAAGRRWMRVLAAFGGLCCVALIVSIVGFVPQGLDRDGNTSSIPWLHIPVLVAGMGAAAFVLLRRRVPRPPAARARVMIVIASLCGAIALGGPTLVETYEEYRSQTLKRFTIELVAAYPIREPVGPGEMTAVVVNSRGEPGEIVEHDGVRYTLHRDNRLVIPSSEVRRVRLRDGELTIRIGGNARAALVGRSDQRLSQHDALLVNGTLIMIPTYEARIIETLALSSKDPLELRRLYDRLVAD